MNAKIIKPSEMEKLNKLKKKIGKLSKWKACNDAREKMFTENQIKIIKDELKEFLLEKK